MVIHLKLTKLKYRRKRQSIVTNKPTLDANYNVVLVLFFSSIFSPSLPLHHFHFKLMPHFHTITLLHQWLTPPLKWNSTLPQATKTTSISHHTLALLLALITGLILPPLEEPKTDLRPHLLPQTMTCHGKVNYHGSFSLLAGMLVAT